MLFCINNSTVGPDCKGILFLEQIESNSMWFAKYYLGDQVKEGEMCGACVMYGGEDKRLQVLGEETRQERRKKPLGRPRHRNEGSVQRSGSNGVDLSGSV